MKYLQNPDKESVGIFEEVKFLLNYPDLDINNLDNLSPDVRDKL